jgi:hypothetical protein
VQLKFSMKHWSEIYRTKQGVIFQDNKRNGFVVEWQGERSFLKMPWYFSLKRALDAVNLEEFLLARHDFELITACGCERIFMLNAEELLEFKDLFAGAKVMMELNSLMHERLRRPVFCV